MIRHANSVNEVKYAISTFPKSICWRTIWKQCIFFIETTEKVVLSLVRSISKIESQNLKSIINDSIISLYHNNVFTLIWLELDFNTRSDADIIYSNKSDLRVKVSINNDTSDGNKFPKGVMIKHNSLLNNMSKTDLSKS